MSYEHHDLIWYSQVDINAALNGGAPDVGVLYEIPEAYADRISVDAAGIVTPLKAPAEGIEGCLVVVKNAATGKEMGKVVIVIKMSDLGNAVVTIDPVGPTTDRTPPLVPTLSAEWKVTDESSFRAPGGAIVISWDAPTDPESGVVSSVLDVRSQDGLDILANHVNVMNMTSTSLPRLMNGKTYDVTLTVTNGAGLPSVRHATVIVPEDYTPPNFLSDAPVIELTWENDVLTLVWPGTEDPESGIASYVLTLSDAAGTDVLADSISILGEYPRKLTWPRTKNGLFYTATAKATNGLGLESSISAGCQVPAIAPPHVNLTGRWSNGQIILDWLPSSDTESYIVANKLEYLKKPDGTVVLSPLLDVYGMTTISFPADYATYHGVDFEAKMNVTDAQGQVGEETITITVPVQNVANNNNQPPSVSIQGDYVNGKLVFNWTVSDDRGVASATFDLRLAGTTTVIATGIDALAQSHYEIAWPEDLKVYAGRVDATDTDGVTNHATALVQAQNKPNQPPVPNVHLDWANDFLSVTFSATDPENDPIKLTLYVASADGTEVFANNIDVTGQASPLLFPRTKNGNTYVAILKALDIHNNAGSASDSKTLDPANKPPVAHVGLSWVAGELVVNWSASDPDGNATSAKLTVQSNDGSEVFATNVEVFGGPNTINYSGVPLHNQTYTATLVVTDAGGLQDTATDTFSLIATNAPPVVDGFTGTYANGAISFSWTGLTDPDGSVTVAKMNVQADNGHVFALQDDLMGNLAGGSRTYPADLATYSDQNVTVTFFLTDNQGQQVRITHTIKVDKLVLPDTTPPIATLKAEWKDDKLLDDKCLAIATFSGTDPESGITSMVLTIKSIDGTDVLCDNLDVTTLGYISYPRPRNDKTYKAILVVTNGVGLKTTVVASFVVPAPLINTPINVTYQNNGDDTATVTWYNLLDVDTRMFNIGMRIGGTDVSLVNPSNGRLLEESALFSGFGPHSYTLQVPRSIADASGTTTGYDWYVQDTVTTKVGLASNSGQDGGWKAATRSQSVFNLLSANWVANTNTIDINWAGLIDIGNNVAKLTLTVKSKDGSVVFADHIDVTNTKAAGGTASYPRDRDGLKYLVTLTAYSQNGNVFRVWDATSVTVQVPFTNNRPYNVTAVDSGDQTVTVTWYNIENVLKRAFYVGARKKGTTASHESAAGRLAELKDFQVSGTGPVSFVLPMGVVATGDYEFYVEDAVTSRLAHTLATHYTLHDSTGPVLTLSGAWNNDTLSFTWSAMDPESAVTGLRLTVKSADGTEVLASDVNVFGQTTTSFPRTKNGKTYVATLSSVNFYKLTSEMQASVTVPDDINNIVSVTASQVTGTNTLDVSWTNTSLFAAGPNPYYIGLRPVNGTGSATAGGDRIYQWGPFSFSGQGPHHEVVDMASAPISTTNPMALPSGNYEVYVQDAAGINDLKVGQIAFTNINPVVFNMDTSNPDMVVFTWSGLNMSQSGHGVTIDIPGVGTPYGFSNSSSGTYAYGPLPAGVHTCQIGVVGDNGQAWFYVWQKSATGTVVAGSPVTNVVATPSTTSGRDITVNWTSVSDHNQPYHISLLNSANQDLADIDVTQSGTSHTTTFSVPVNVGIGGDGYKIRVIPYTIDTNTHTDSDSNTFSLAGDLSADFSVAGQVTLTWTNLPNPDGEGVYIIDTTTGTQFYGHPQFLPANKATSGSVVINSSTPYQQGPAPLSPGVHTFNIGYVYGPTNFSGVQGTVTGEVLSPYPVITAHMTSNNTPAPDTVTAMHDESGNVSRIFDGSVATVWDWSAFSFYGEQYVDYVYGGGKMGCPKGIRMRAENTSPYLLVALQGSNDGATWTDLSGYAGVGVYTAINNSTYFSHLRVRFNMPTGPSAGGHTTSEIEIFGLTQ